MPKITFAVGRDPQESQAYDWFVNDWKDAFLALDPSLEFAVWPDVCDKSAVDFVCVWKHPPGLLKQFPGLKCIASLAAGVDHVLTDPELPAHVPIVRVMDTYMANDIVQYVTAYVLHHIKRIDHWSEKQRSHTWFRQPPFSLTDRKIGILGLGFLGSKAAYILQELGLQVSGFSHSKKILPGVKTFSGRDQFAEFLSQSQIIICMLPLTPKTEGILCKETFLLLPRGAFVINIGRGEHLVESDLLDALQNGQVEQACLDVFSQEPLPSDHPFWVHPKIRITPHIASVTHAKTAAPQVLDNFHRMCAGLEYINRVDTQRGY